MGRNAPPTQMTHNNLPKYIVHLRNHINQQQQNTSIVTPDVLNVNQQHFHQQHDIVETNTNYNNLNVTTSNASTMTAAGAAILPSILNNQPFLMCAGSAMAGAAAAPPATGDGHSTNVTPVNYHQSSSIMNNINSYNFDLNELKEPKTTTKMLPKSSTGNKRMRQIREREQNNLNGATGSDLGGNGAVGGAGGAWSMPLHDLNLTSTSATRQGSKSTAKLFDDLKENVYLEVSALIAANESRPEFLINLFRDLQLISTSDPLRNRLLQAFKEVYNQYGELGLDVLQDEATLANAQVRTERTNNAQEHSKYLTQLSFHPKMYRTTLFVIFG